MKLAIEGMTCGHCVAAVTRALERLPGAVRVAVRLKPGEASVDGVEAATALRAIADEGYVARVVEAPAAP